MAELIYRGAPVKAQAQETQTLADQMRRPTLIYRGLEHDGHHPVEPTTKKEVLFYRGVRLA